VLYDQNFNFALRHSILEKIIPDVDTKQIENLNRLSTIRNYFAHIGQEIFKGAELPSEGQVGIVYDPRNLDKSIDFTQLYEEFQTKEPTVAEYLFKLYQELGGEYIKG